MILETLFLLLLFYPAYNQAKNLSTAKAAHVRFFYSRPFVSLFHLFRRALDLSAPCMFIVFRKFLFICASFDAVR